MTADQIKRMVMGFSADMERVMLEPGNMSKMPQFEELSFHHLMARLANFARQVYPYLCDNAWIAAQRACVHVANLAMMIHWHAEQRRLEERGKE